MSADNEPAVPVEGVRKTIAELSGAAAGPRTVSLADANRQYGFIHCFHCGVGGHTGHSLVKVVKNVATQEMGMACATHALAYIRPKDLKRKRR